MALSKSLIFAVILTVSSQMHAVESSYHAFTGSQYDSNTGLAELSVDTVYNIETEFQFGTTWRIEPVFNAAYLATAEFGAKRYSNISQMNENSIHLSINKMWQKNFEYTSPFYSAKLAMDTNSVVDSRRNTSKITGQFVFNKRLNDRFFVNLGGDVEVRRSNWGIYDGVQTRLFLATDYLQRNGSIWYGSTALAYGDTWSTLQTQYCNGAFALDIWPTIQASTTIMNDDAFNDAFCGNWVAYRLAGTTANISLGFNKPLTKNASLDLSTVGAYQYTSADTIYMRYLIRMAVLWSW